jgi:hypothetical protein
VCTELVLSALAAARALLSGDEESDTVGVSVTVFGLAERLTVTPPFTGLDALWLSASDSVLA